MSESTACVCRFWRLSFLLATCLPPRESNHEISQFIDELNITIQNRKLRNKKIILSGDFNINLLKFN